MKKGMLVGMYSLLVMSLYGMDTFDCKYGGTIIRVSYESIADLDEKVDVLVVGMKKQSQLLAFYNEADGLWFNSGLRRHSDNEIGFKIKIQECSFIQKKKMKSTVILSGEPEEFTQYELQEECLIDFRDNKKNMLRLRLAECYKKCLSEVAQEVLSDNQNRTIAISLFGKSNVFSHEEVAPIAVKAIIDSLKTNPNSYTLIHLLVKNDVMVKLLYKQLLHENV